MATKDNIISLKVKVASKSSTGEATVKVMRFASEMSIAEILKEIRTKLEETGGKDHGIFMPPVAETGKAGKWLEKNKTLKFYNIQNMTVVEFKKKHRPLRIRLVDDTTKLVIIDDSKTVREISDAIGEKIGLKSAEEFSLRRPGGTMKAPLWLMEQQPLHEQGITEDEELEFSKKFYFSDDFIDKEDPFSLHLLYVEANKGVVGGRYKVTRNDAKDFAALQLQIVYGDHDPAKHKAGFFEIDDFVAEPYRKDKKIVTDILRDHRKLVGMNDVGAKFRYVQLVRSLKTYGVTFFDCQLRVKGKKKPVPITIGITRDKIMKIDPETDRVMKEWTFMQMRRWSSVKNNFTLDFGDYEDDYLNMTTEEAEPMSALIAGYIDIILRTRVDQSRAVEHSDEEFAEEEQMEVKFGLAHTGFTSSMSNPYGQGAGMEAQMGGNMIGFQPGQAVPQTTAMFPRSKNINVTDLGTAQRAINTLAMELGSAAAAWGSPPGQLTQQDLERQFLIHKSNLLNGVNDLLGQARLGPNGLNRNQLDTKAKELAMELRSIATYSKHLSTLNQEKRPLLSGAKAVADSVSDLMQLLMGAVEHPEIQGFEQALEAVEKQVKASHMLLDNVEMLPHSDQGAHLLAIEAIHGIETSLETLLEGIEKHAANAVPPQDAQLKALVASSKLVKGPVVSNLGHLAPYTLDPRVAQQVGATQNVLAQLGKEILTKAQASGLTADKAPELVECVDRLNDNLDILRLSLLAAEKRGIPQEGNLHTPSFMILDTLSQIRDTADDSKKVLDLMKPISTVQADLAQAIPIVNRFVDPLTRDQLTKAEPAINSNIKDLMDSMKYYGKRPHDMEAKEKVLAAATALESQAHTLLAGPATLTALTSLRFYTKSNASAFVSLMNVVRKAQPEIPDRQLQAQLDGAVKAVRGTLPELLASAHEASMKPDDIASQARLMKAVKSSAPQLSELTSLAKKAARVVTSANTQQELDEAATEAAKGLRSLMHTVQEVTELRGEQEFEAAMEEFQVVKSDLETANFYAEQGLLKPVPGQTRENSAPLLVKAIESLAHGIIDLAKASKQGHPIGDKVGQVAQCVAQIAASAKPVAASFIGDRAAQKGIVGTAKELVDNTINVVALARTLDFDPSSQPKNQGFARALVQFQATLGSLRENAQKVHPGDINRALESIQKATEQLDVAPGKLSAPYEQLREDLNEAAKALSGTVSNLVSTARVQPEFLGYRGKVTGAAAAELLSLARETAAASNDRDVQEPLIAAARELGNSLSKLLPSTVEVAQSKTAPNLEKLNRNVAQVNDAIEDVLVAVGKAGEATAAASQLMATLAALDSGKLDVIPGSRQDILNEVLSCGKDLGQVQPNLVNAAQSGNDKMGMYAREVANAASKIIMASKAANLPENTSEFIHLDATRVARGADYILANIKDTTKAEGIAKQITKAVGGLIATSKARAQEEPDPAKRQAIIKASQKIVADATDLAKAARSVTQKEEGSQEVLAKAARSIKVDIKTLEDSLKTAPGPNTPDLSIIDNTTAQKLMIESRALAVASADLIRASVALSANPDSAKAKEDLTRQSDATNAALQGLLKVTGTLNPVVQRVERAIDVSTKASADLEAAALASQSGGKINITPTDKPVKELQGEVLAACKQIAFDMKELLVAANKTPEEIMLAMEKFEKNPPALAIASIQLAATMKDDAQRAQLLAMAKLLSDNLGGFLRALKGASLNDSAARADMTRHSDNAAKSLGLLLQQIQSGAQLTQGLEKNAADVQAAVARLNKPGVRQNYPEAREELIEASREVAGHVTSLISADKRNAGEVGIITTRLVESTNKLVDSARNAAASTSEQEAASEILSCVKEIGDSVSSSILVAKDMTEGSDKLKELLDSYNSTNVGISRLLGATKKGAVGETTMDNAIIALRETLSRVNLNDLLLRADQLEAASEAKMIPFTSLQSQLANELKKFPKLARLVKDNAKSSERELSANVEDTVETIRTIADLALMSASRAHNSPNAVGTLEGIRDVAAVAIDLIAAAKHVHMSPKDSEPQKALARAHRAAEERTSKLVAVVENVGTQITQDAKELENCKQSLIALISAGEDMPGKEGATPDEVVNAAKELLMAVGRFSSATESTEIVAAGRQIQDVTKKFLQATKGASNLTDDLDIQQGLILAGTNTARALTDLLDVGKVARDDEGVKAKVDENSGKVAASINTFVYALKKLPNTDDIQLEKPGDDLDSLAENELLRCADIIAKAAETLRSYRPPPRDKKISGMVDQQDISEAILDAAMAIAQATGQLVQVAAVAQQERTKMKMVADARYNNDPTWAQGLVSAAQSVAASVQQLVKSANGAVDGSAEEEVLVVSARAVATATAHLVSASRAKADPNSATQAKLKSAAKAVTDSTSSLVTAAATAAEFNRPEEVIEVPDISSAKGKVLELEQEMKILKLEKDLEAARRSLLAFRKQRYNRKN